ncbi:MAG: DUF47 domain-containing protein [bacterium]
MAIMFKSPKMLAAQIDEFLDAVSEGALVFKQAIKNYLEGETDHFEERIITIGNLENTADELRRKIENQLYSQSLIPEHRGDVLGLLENMDDVIDTAKNTLNQFSIESPEIEPELNQDYLELAEMAANAAEAIVLATRAFFKDINAIKDHLHKVYFFEKEADKISYGLKRRVFSMDIALSRKIHLRDFAVHVDNVSDRAQEVADRLAIYAIKRAV